MEVSRTDKMYSEAYKIIVSKLQVKSSIELERILEHLVDIKFSRKTNSEKINYFAQIVGEYDERYEYY